MVTALSSQNLTTDTWVPATWEEFVAMCNQLEAFIERPELEKAQCYYDYGWMRIETISTGAGQKRLLYERLGVQEYWVVDVQSAVMIAFAICGGGSRQIQVSQVLPGLTMSTIEEAHSKISHDRSLIAGSLR
ncbi:MAG: Uma2 family endonuclease [Nostocaceae cyanobacterium]|nr:Uma2 family endonuclease [Nostocaceae cyanobacterium]